jgi:hypothetical protein
VPEGLAIFGALRSHVWAYPALEIVHIASIALLLGNLILLELRVFGLGTQLPVKPLARLSLGLACTGFGFAAASGLLMFASQPAELLANRAFTLKMLLLLLAACNAAWFHGRDSLGRLDATARFQMAVSSVIWLAVIACGRWIAYL